jgi:spermidine dehydrogenase
MSEESRERELGMDRKITRRDFLNGAAVAMGAALAPFESLGARDSGPDTSAIDPLFAEGLTQRDWRYYPPGLVGMRGNHPGSFEVAHQLRDGTFWDQTNRPVHTGEAYDLVIVGGGISGLAAAYFYRQHVGRHARILILDNHDDFGGHAKRNEFEVGGRLLLSNGGTQSIDSPGEYSGVAMGLLRELGIHTSEFYKDYDQKLYSHLKTGCFFNREAFGADRLVLYMNSTPWPEFLAQAPLSGAARRDIARVYTEKVDYMLGLTREQKQARLAKMSYADFLTNICHVHPDALPFFQTFPADLFGVGIDAVSALSCHRSPDDYQSFTYPGFGGMDLDEEGVGAGEPYIFHFPDGNASIARLLVRSLFPESIPGRTMGDVVMSRADYTRLDRVGLPVRMRLNSTVVRARHTGAIESAKEVEVDYMCAGKLFRVQAKSCILACYNMMIPYLCPELPEKQQEALHYGVKVPYLYTHVALRNWTSFAKLGIHQIVAPAGYHTYAALDFPVSMGRYEFPSRPEDPMILFLMRSPCQPGLPRRAQYKAGRGELYTTPFALIERNIRDQLQRMLGGGEFDPARDIEAITVNRWAHGYAYEYESLSDSHWLDGERPCVVARQRFGRISIANSDAAARAYTDAAIDMAWRAVQEQLKDA